MKIGSYERPIVAQIIGMGFFGALAAAGAWEEGHYLYQMLVYPEVFRRTTEKFVQYSIFTTISGAFSLFFFFASIYAIVEYVNIKRMFPVFGQTPLNAWQARGIRPEQYLSELYTLPGLDVLPEGGLTFSNEAGRVPVPKTANDFLRTVHRRFHELTVASGRSGMYIVNLSAKPGAIYFVSPAVNDGGKGWFFHWFALEEEKDSLSWTLWSATLLGPSGWAKQPGQDDATRKFLLNMFSDAHEAIALESQGSASPVQTQTGIKKRT